MNWWSKHHIEKILGKDSDLDVNEIKKRLMKKRMHLVYSILCSYLSKIDFENKNSINDSMNLTTTQMGKRFIWWKIQRLHLE